MPDKGGRRAHSALLIYKSPLASRLSHLVVGVHSSRLTGQGSITPGNEESYSNFQSRDITAFRSIVIKPKAST